jgi:hypothetical protein
MGSRGSPWGGGEARGARTASGDGELIGEEEAAEEALRLGVIAIGLRLQLVLDEEEVMAERIPGLGGDEGGRWWLEMMSRGERPRAERSGAKVARGREMGAGLSH